MIRHIKESDVETLAKFEREISEISFGDEAVTDLDVHMKKIRKSIKMKNDGMFIKEENNNIIGWIWLDTKKNMLTEESYVNFRSFYIVEEFRGSNVPEELLNYGMNYCRLKNAKYIVGRVNVNNLPMRALYKKFNFKSTHITMEYKFKKEDYEC